MKEERRERPNTNSALSSSGTGSLLAQTAIRRLTSVDDVDIVGTEEVRAPDAPYNDFLST